MPQMNLYEPSKDLVGIRISWTWPDDVQVGGPVSTIELRTFGGDWFTLISQRWEGIMLDFITTFMSDVGIAFAFGDRRAVLSAAQSTHRAARAHMKSHQHD